MKRGKNDQSRGQKSSNTHKVKKYYNIIGFYILSINLQLSGYTFPISPVKRREDEKEKEVAKPVFSWVFKNHESITK